MLRSSHQCFHDMKSCFTVMKANCPPSSVQSSSHCLRCLDRRNTLRLLSVTILGGASPIALPFEAAVDHPAQDRRPLGLELVGQVRVALLGAGFDGERDQQQAPAHGLIDVVEARLVVAGDQQLELAA